MLHGAVSGSLGAMRLPSRASSSDHVGGGWRWQQLREAEILRIVWPRACPPSLDDVITTLVAPSVAVFARSALQSRREVNLANTPDDVLDDVSMVIEAHLIVLEREVKGCATDHNLKRWFLLQGADVVAREVARRSAIRAEIRALEER